MKVRIELEALITEREGMLAENDYRARLGQGIAFGETAFFELAEKMRAVATMDEKEKGGGLRPVPSPLVSDRVFIDHIKAHLPPGCEVICKICGKSAGEIMEEMKGPRLPAWMMDEVLGKGEKS